MRDTEKQIKSVFINTIRAILWAVYGLRYSLLTLLVVVFGVFIYSVFGVDKKTADYVVGGVNIPAFGDGSGKGGYTKVSGTITGEGEYIKNRYEYKDTSIEQAELSEYVNMLEQSYGAVVVDSTLASDSASPYSSSLYMQLEDEKANVSLSYDGSVYVVDVLAEPSKGDTVSTYSQLNKVNSDRAKEILLSLKRSETGFTAEIGVYTIEQHEELADVNGWKYHVFDVIAEYSAKRREHRGTFYISQDDGMVLRYNRDDGSTTLIRKGV